MLSQSLKAPLFPPHADVSPRLSSCRDQSRRAGERGGKEGGGGGRGEQERRRPLRPPPPGGAAAQRMRPAAAPPAPKPNRSAKPPPIKPGKQTKTKNNKFPPRKAEPAGGCSHSCCSGTPALSMADPVQQKPPLSGHVTLQLTLAPMAWLAGSSAPGNTAKLVGVIK